MMSMTSMTAEWEETPKYKYGALVDEYDVKTGLPFNPSANRSYESFG